MPLSSEFTRLGTNSSSNNTDAPMIGGVRMASVWNLTSGVADLSYPVTFRKLVFSIIWLSNIGWSECT